MFQESTEDHFYAFFTEYFASDPNIVRETSEVAGLPDESYNIYMEFGGAILYFTATSVGIPSANELNEIDKDRSHCGLPLG